MLKTGREHLEGLRDGRTVYIGGEKVDDVTTHPAFAAAAQTVADMYDAKRAPENLDTYSFEEDGERYSTWYLRAKSKDDLRKRLKCHKGIADMTYGMFGRSPDHVSGFVTGHVDPAVRLRYRGLEVRRQPGRLLRALPQERRLRDLCRATAPGRAQPGILHAPEPAGADPLGNRRARRRHRDQRHEDAGDQRRSSATTSGSATCCRSRPARSSRR